MARPKKIVEPVETIDATDVSGEGPEPEVVADFVEPTIPEAGEPSKEDVTPEVAPPKPKRIPGVGNQILYTFGSKESNRPGESRCATITKVIDADAGLVQFNIQCAELNDMKDRGFPVAACIGTYDPNGVPATWRYLNQ